MYKKLKELGFEVCFSGSKPGMMKEAFKGEAEDLAKKVGGVVIPPRFPQWEDQKSWCVLVRL